MYVCLFEDSITYQVNFVNFINIIWVLNHLLITRLLENVCFKRWNSNLFSGSRIFRSKIIAFQSFNVKKNSSQNDFICWKTKSFFSNFWMIPTHKQVFLYDQRMKIICIQRLSQRWAAIQMFTSSVAEMFIQEWCTKSQKKPQTTHLSQ